MYNYCKNYSGIMYAGLKSAIPSGTILEKIFKNIFAITLKKLIKKAFPLSTLDYLQSI